MKKVCIIGGCGHVGIPLGLAFAKKGLDVTLLDVNPQAVEAINAGRLPFREEGAADLLRAHVGKNLRATSQLEIVKKQDVVVFVTGTPVDEHLNPKIHDVLKVISLYMPFLNKRQLIVLRSTIFPGVTRIVENLLRQKGHQRRTRTPDVGPGRPGGNGARPRRRGAGRSVRKLLAGQARRPGIRPQGGPHRRRFFGPGRRHAPSGAPQVAGQKRTACLRTMPCHCNYSMLTKINAR